MILTANRNVNVRVGGPSTAKFSSRFLKIGETIDAHARRWGERIEGRSDWLVAAGNEMLTTVAFEDIAAINELPFEDVPDLINKYKLYLMWAFSRGEGVKVGVIDDGVAQHPSLKVKVEPLNQHPTDTEMKNNHGTTMACIIAANDPEHKKVGVAGIISEMYSYCIPTATFGPDELYTALKMMFDKGVNIINMSVSSTNESLYPSTAGGEKVKNLISNMAQNDTILVCSTGNHGMIHPLFYPAAYNNNISVAGFNARNQISVDSNAWNNVSIALPSEEAYFSDAQQQHSYHTSGASAMLCGIISCIYNVLPKYNKNRVLKELLSSFPHISSAHNPEIKIPAFESSLFIQKIKELI